MSIKPNLLVTILLIVSCEPNSQHETLQESSIHRPVVSNTWDFPEARQFDFWIGEWDVNLRMINQELAWEDSILAKAKIYPVLDGKAILELWHSKTITGFSIRYYDVLKKKWILWLNWPGKNRSGISSLEGVFRHGRGEFSFEYANRNGQFTMATYTFSDISPDRLRWDDAYSLDSGKTWSRNWIMEFSRTADLPDSLIMGQPLHTYEHNTLCNNPEFQSLKYFEGSWKGTFTSSAHGGQKEYPITIEAYKITNGCASLLFVEYENIKEIHLQTYNTRLQQWEQSVLSNQSDKGMKVYRGQVDRGALETIHRDSIASEKYHWELGDSTLRFKQYKLNSSDSNWTLTGEANFSNDGH